MRHLMLGATAIAAVAMTMNFATPASAQGVASGATKLNTLRTQQNLVTPVRWRGRRHWHRRHWRHHHRHGWGPGVGVAIGTGLLLGGLAASAQAQAAVDWCDAHYRSYDRASQTYLGYDGYRHSCP
jgi:hypothetical protein